MVYLLSQGIENLDLHQRLVMEPLLVPYDLDGHGLVGLVIKALYGEGGRESIEDLISHTLLTQECHLSLSHTHIP